MRVLALDTATEECAVGIGEWPRAGDGEAEVLGELNLDVPRAALTHLMPGVVRLLDACDVRIRDVEAVVVGRGPGSFTGVRIGVAAAKGLAHGLGVPLWGIGTLDAVAERFRGREGLVAVIGDAMRGEVYPALFRCSSGAVERLWADSVAKPELAAGEIASAVGSGSGSRPGQVLLVGNGLRKYRDVFLSVLGDTAEVADGAEWTPTGASLLSAAWHLRAFDEPGAVGEVLPVYTRLSDAEENERDRACDAPPSSGVAGPAEGERP